jgi:hypothetical protein
LKKKILALGGQKRSPKPPYDFKVSYYHNYPQAFAGELETSTDKPQKYTGKKATRFHANGHLSEAMFKKKLAKLIT